jgi:hypothetical protein
MAIAAFAVFLSLLCAPAAAFDIAATPDCVGRLSGIAPWEGPLRFISQVWACGADPLHLHDGHRHTHKTQVPTVVFTDMNVAAAGSERHPL